MIGINIPAWLPPKRVVKQNQSIDRPPICHGYNYHHVLEHKETPEFLTTLTHQLQIARTPLRWSFF
jgi:hypothetical protein